MNIETLKSDLKKFERYSHNQFGYKQYADPIIKAVPEIINEIEQANKLILQLLDMDIFIINVKAGLEEEAESDPYNFADEDYNVSVDENDIDRHIETEWENKYPEFDVPTAVYEAVHEHFNGNTFTRDLETNIKEVIEDEQAYERDPLKYVGMSERDFL